MNRRPGIQCPPHLPGHRHIAGLRNAARDGARRARLRRFQLDELRPAPQCPTNKYGPKQPPVMLVHLACQACKPLLIRHWRLPQVYRAVIREGQRETDCRESFVAIEQLTAVIVPEKRTTLGNEEMVARLCVVDGRRDFGRERVAGNLM